MSNLRLPHYKPSPWAIDPGAIAYNALRMGLPVPIVCIPFWSNTIDLSGQRNDAQNNGADWVIGKFGRCLDFNQANDDFLLISHSPSINLSTKATFAIQVKPDILNDDFHRLFHKNGAYAIYISDAGSRLGIWHYATGTFDLGTIGSLTAGEDIFIVVTKNSAGEKIYINGQLINTFTSNGAKANFPTNTNNLYIGIDEDELTRELDGTISNLLMWNIDLTPSQVAAISNNPYDIVEPIRRPIWAVPAALTTAAPTTIPPTTLAPTTLAPTTAAPTTLAPTTLYQTTIGPTTKPPTTGPATTVPPTTFYPSTEAPTTSPATTVPPTTSAPTTTAPTSPAPTTLAPTTIPPTTLAPPTTLFQTTAGPTTKVPTTPEPTTPAPTTVAPTTSVPTTAEPTTLAPTTAEPTTLAPTTLAPTTLAPTTIGPTTIPPTTVAPTTGVPTTTLTTVPPTTAAPETICIKALNSIIVKELSLRSLITKEIRSNGYLC